MELNSWYITVYINWTYTLCKIISSIIEWKISFWINSFWNPTNNALLFTFTGHTSAVLGLAALQSGMLASGSDDNTVKIWNPTQGSLLLTLIGHTNSTICNITKW
jgi:WD40 repeat protein